MSSDNVDFINKCLRQWKGEFPLDERLQYFSDQFEDWLMQIPADSREIVKTLIFNMSYYSNATSNKWLEMLHKELLKQENVTNDNTIYAFLKSPDGLSNSSNDYWTNYKAINRINSNLCVENLDAIYPEQWELIDNIVFIDDFSGTGNTFIKELEKRPTTYSGKRIFFIALNVMQLAIDKINEFADEYDIKIIFLVSKIQHKAFERNLFTNDNEAKNNIAEMSTALGIPSNHILGYEETESLVSFYNNTPNNTLGFIRYDTQDYKSIFPRKNETKPAWQRFGSKKSRKAANYNNKVLEGKK